MKMLFTLVFSLFVVISFAGVQPVINVPVLVGHIGQDHMFVVEGENCNTYIATNAKINYNRQTVEKICK